MTRTRKKESNSSSASSRNRTGRKSRSNLIKSSPSKKRSLIKGVGKSTRKKTSISPARVTKKRTLKTSKARSTKRSPVVRASRKSVVHKTKSSSRALRSSSKKQISTRANKKIIRVLGHGQFSVDSETLRKLNAIDNSIVRRFEKENLTDEEFKMKIEQLGEIVTKKGKLLDPKVIVSSDIILPGSDLTIEEASKIFHGEGIIPGLD